MPGKCTCSVSSAAVVFTRHYAIIMESVAWALWTPGAVPYNDVHNKAPKVVPTNEHAESSPHYDNENINKQRISATLDATVALVDVF